MLIENNHNYINLKRNSQQKEWHFDFKYECHFDFKYDSQEDINIFKYKKPTKSVMP